MKLNDKLNNLCSYPFHMPGHKRNSKFDITGCEIDITEISGFDDLHNPKSILKELEDRFTKLYKCNKSIICTNGSTCGILSSISGICNHNDEIIIARNCHKSVYNACYINHLKVHYIMPQINKEFNCMANITQGQIDEAIRDFPNAKCIVITSPTYEGFVSNVKSSIPIIVDSAHGAHLGFSNKFLPYQCGDIIVSSLHKTLPALTQASIINIYNEKYIKSIKEYIDIFETSSPSYIILNSIEKCSDFLDNCNNDFDNLFSLIMDLKKYILTLDNIDILSNELCDITKINLIHKNMCGVDFGNALRENGIECEMCTSNYVTLMSTVGDSKQGFDLLKNALNIINELKCNHKKCKVWPTIPKQYCNSWEINNCELTDIYNSLGKICGEFVFAYPPGIPIIVPGEIIDKNTIDLINNSFNLNLNIVFYSTEVKDNILTKEQI